MVSQYKMVQIPPEINIRQKDAKGQEAALYLEGVVSEYARNGWEFLAWMKSLYVSIPAVSLPCLAQGRPTKYFT